MQAIEERVCDQPVLKLLRRSCAQGSCRTGRSGGPVTGAPQGGLFQPPPLQRLPAPAGPGMGRADGFLVRFADDRAPRARLEVAM